MSEAHPLAAPEPRKPLGPKLAGWLATTALVGTAVSAGITQWTAARLGYHPLLGDPLIGGLYQPFAWIGWRNAGWPGAAAHFAMVDKLLLLGLCFAPAVLAYSAQTGRRRPKKHPGVHGTARFAERRDLEAARLLPPRPGPLARLSGAAPAARGLYLACHAERDGSLTYIRHQGLEHIFVPGPTRVGKTQGPVMMNCLSGEDESLICYDAKGTIYETTAGWRREVGQKVLRWEPMALANTVRWNPLREVRLGTIHEFSDVANIIEHIADPEGEGLDGGRDHFPPVAAAFLTGATLFVLYERRARGEWACVPDVLAALQDPDRPPDALYRAMVENRFGAGGTRHEQIARTGAAQARRPERERGSVQSVAGRMLRLFEDPIIARNTAVSDFAISDLMDADQPVGLYIIPREEHRLRLRPLTRLFNTLAMAKLCSADIPKGAKPHRHPLRWIYDEFAAEGKQDTFVSAMARCAEYGIRVMLLVQDYQQILDEYGDKETVTGACHIMVGYTPNNAKTAEWMAGWTGRATLITEDVSESGQSGETKRGFNRTYHTVSRQLMTEDEIGRLDRPMKDDDGRITAPGQVLIRAAGMHVAREIQALYFFDPEFLARASIPAPPTDTMRLAA